MITFRHILIPIFLCGSALGRSSIGFKSIDPQQNYRGQVVFLGDSITYFWIQNGFQQWNEFYDPVGAVNTGWPGDWTFDVINKLNQGLIDEFNPRLVVLKIGTNDLGGDGTDTSVYTNIGAIINLVKEKNPGVKILLLGILPRNGVDVHLKIRSANEMIQNYADGDTVFFLNMENAFSSQLGSLLPGMSDDGVHLTQLGYQTWSQTMNPLFFSLLNDSPMPTTTTTTTGTGPTTTTTTTTEEPPSNWNKRGQVIFLGDSITDFWDNDGIATYNQFYEPLGTVNTGVSGDWTTTVISRIIVDGIINNLNAYVAVLKIGTNDLSADTPAQTVADNILQIINLIKETNRGVKVLLLGILPRGDGWDGINHQRVRNVNEIIKNYDSLEGVFYLNMEEAFSYDLGMVYPELYWNDWLHLSDQGYMKWAETMNPLFDQILQAPFPAKAVWLGDSITAQWLSTGSPVWNQHYAQIQSVNFAIGGHTSEQTIGRIQTEGVLNGLNSKVAMLMVGINDLYTGVPATRVVANIQTIVELTRQKLPHGRIILFGILPVGELHEPLIKEAMRVNDALAEIGSWNDDVQFVDMWSEFADGDNNIHQEYYVEDQVHLSLLGYELWQQTVDNTFEEMLQFK